MIRVVNKSDNYAEIYITGDIVSDDIENWFYSDEEIAGYEWPKKLREELEAVKDKDLKIFINSDGGRVAEGIAMANMIKRHKGHTVAAVDGWCCSAATLIYFAADEQEMPDNTYLMIHKPAAATGGTADDLRQAADMLDKMQEGIECEYLKKAQDTVKAEDIHKYVDAETWFNAQEAAKTFKIKLTDAVQAVAIARTKPTFKVPSGIKYRVAAKADPKIKEAKAALALALAL